VPLGVVIGLTSAVVTAVVTEVYCHRCLAHRAFRVQPGLASFLERYFRVVVGTDPATWAAVHRLHHRYADTPLDPHSPVQRQPLAVQLGSPFLFASARGRVPRGTPRGRSDLVVRVSIIAFFFVLLGAVQGLLMLGAHLVGYMGVMGAVNAVGHLYGRKPHPEAAGYDLAWLAIPLLGHGYHNSHHAHPAAARTGPLDPIWPLLRLLAAAGLLDLEDRRASTPRACCGALAPPAVTGRGATT
jgi:stearoyl-CoA desaturase (delta-9 desaturase)